MTYISLRFDAYFICTHSRHYTHHFPVCTYSKNFITGKEGDLPVGFPDRFNSSFYYFLSFSLAFSFNISIVPAPISLKLDWCIATKKYRSPIHFQDRTLKVKVTRRQNKKILNSWFLCRFSFDLLQTLPVYSQRAIDKPSWFSGP